MIKSSEELFSAVFRFSPIGIAILRASDGRFVDVNDVFVKITGYPREEIIGHTPLELNLLDDSEESELRLTALMQQGSLEPFEYTTHTKSGEIGVGLSATTAITVDGEKHYLSMILDITGRKHMENALRESEAQVNQLIEGSPVAMLVWSGSEERVEMINAEFTELFGYTIEDIPDGEHWWRLAYPDEISREEVKKHWKARVERSTSGSGQVGPAEAPVTCKDGSRRIIEFRISSVGTKNIVTFVDLTESKQAGEALKLYADRLDQAESYARLGSWEFDAITGKGWWSKQMYHLLGFKELNEVPGNDEYLEHIHPDDRALVQEVLIRMAQGQEPVPHEFRSNPEYGPLRYFDPRFFVESGPQGRPLKFIGTLQDITEHKQSEEKIKRQVEYLSALRDIDLAIATSFDMRLSLDSLVFWAKSLLAVDAAAVLLVDPAMTTIKYGAGIGFQTTAFETAEFKLEESYARRAAVERRMIQIKNLAEEPEDHHLNTLLKGENFVSFYGVPLIVKGEVVGVLEIFHRSVIDRDQEWLDFLKTLATQAAIAIDNAQLLDSLQHSNIDLTLAYDATIEGWSRAMDLRDKETEGHTQRVTDLTLNLARAMHLSESQLIHIRRGALLHDIGKLGVPDSILFRPNKLSDEEWAIMRKHPTYAYEMLASIDYLKPALDIPYCHHEKWDGSGYPRGLKGEEIPLAARLFAVVDVFDALTSDRPYSLAWSREAADEYIREQSGKYFDPQVVDIFLSSHSRMT